MADVMPVMFDLDEVVEWICDHTPTLDDVETAFARVGRNAGPALLADLHYEGGLAPAWYAPLVPSVWNRAEWPQDHLPRDMWRELFAAAGYTVDGNRRGRPTAARTLYRGADEAHRDGWSWTDSKRQAQWFADRPIHNPPGQVWTAVVEPDRLLAHLTGKGGRRGESEWIVDTDGLRITPTTD